MLPSVAKKVADLALHELLWLKLATVAITNISEGEFTKNVDSTKTSN